MAARLALQGLLVHWINSATGFEGEVVKRFLGDIAAAQSSYQGGGSFTEGANPNDPVNRDVQTPKSKWNGQMSTV